ncbi:DUF4259 domain-containing protein [Actinomadura soli]|uniref:DUF4259 domain-containing protein n=1 Tax=Actinomadura soli TaxID=2508997 RepID=A0A5C4JFQ4_9ACTN|nr:DUF4259 domain-containing protein [Actinomadura soli]TMR03453.1 DUF4259 domain-containing protein [Actinomadura soli]
MSASGVGPFENDDAQDFKDELFEASEGERSNMVREVLQRVASIPADSFLDREFAEPAVAAAALVSASIRGDEATFEDAKLPIPPLDWSSDLCRLALTALRKVVRENSEICAEWFEVGLGEEWKSGVDTLMEQLSQGIE